MRPVDLGTISRFIQLLKPNKAAGLDRIPTRMIRDAITELTPSITYLVNKSIKDGKFPELWKIARVTPLHKSDDKLNVDNYRPISILPVLSKIMERVVYAQLTQFIDANNSLYHHQYGFRCGHSTVQAVAQLNNWTLQYMDQGKVVGSLFVDISKAFDSLNHKILLGKLASLGVSNQSLCWFKSYLSQRKQSVVINGSVSDSRLIQLGVPQGSILGPLLFNIYINSLPNATSDAKVILYADDAVLLCTGSTQHELKESLGLGFSQICNWYHDNKLTLNVKKTKLMVIGSKNSLVSFEDFRFEPDDNVAIDRVTSFKYLGVTTDEKWNWKAHVRNLIKKLGHRICVFNRICHMLDMKSRIAYYNGLVLPHLDYGDILWGDQPGLKSEMEQLQAFQNKFARKVLGKKVSSKEALKELSWVPLEDRRRIHRCFLVQNAIKGNIPEHFENFKSPLNTHGYNTRNGHLPRFGRIRTEWGRRLTCYQATIEWQNLPLSIRQPMPKNIFKRHLNEYFLDRTFNN